MFIGVVIYVLRTVLKYRENLVCDYHDEEYAFNSVSAAVTIIKLAVQSRKIMNASKMNYEFSQYSSVIIGLRLKDTLPIRAISFYKG